MLVSFNRRVKSRSLQKASGVDTGGRRRVSGALKFVQTGSTALFLLALLTTCAGLGVSRGYFTDLLRRAADFADVRVAVGVRSAPWNNR